MSAPFRDNADRFGPKPDIEYPVLSKYDGAPFFDMEGIACTAYLQAPIEGLFNRYVIIEDKEHRGMSETASFDILRQAWLV